MEKLMTKASHQGSLYSKIGVPPNSRFDTIYAAISNLRHARTLEESLDADRQEEAYNAEIASLRLLDAKTRKDYNALSGEGSIPDDDMPRFVRHSDLYERYYPFKVAYKDRFFLTDPLAFILIFLSCTTTLALNFSALTVTLAILTLITLLVSLLSWKFSRVLTVIAFIMNGGTVTALLAAVEANNAGHSAFNAYMTVLMFAGLFLFSRTSYDETRFFKNPRFIAPRRKRRSLDGKVIVNPATLIPPLTREQARFKEWGETIVNFEQDLTTQSVYAQALKEMTLMQGVRLFHNVKLTDNVIVPHVLTMAQNHAIFFFEPKDRLDSEEREINAAIGLAFPGVKCYRFDISELFGISTQSLYTEVVLQGFTKFMQEENIRFTSYVDKELMRAMISRIQPLPDGTLAL